MTRIRNILSKSDWWDDDSSNFLIRLDEINNTLWELTNNNYSSLAEYAVSFWFVEENNCTESAWEYMGILRTLIKKHFYQWRKFGSKPQSNNLIISILIISSSLQLPIEECKTKYQNFKNEIIKSGEYNRIDCEHWQSE